MAWNLKIEILSFHPEQKISAEGKKRKKKKEITENAGEVVDGISDRRATMKISSLIVSSRVAVNRASLSFSPPVRTP